MKRAILLSLLGSCGVAAPALAQQSDATDGLGSVSSENSFGRDRNVSVLERRRPDYTPEPIHVGTLELLPRMAIGVGYDDNLYAQPDDEIGDAYVRIRPRLSLVRPSPDLKLSLDGELDLLRYADRSRENATQYSVNAGALYTISRSDTLNLTLRNGRYSQERVSPDSPTQASRPIRFTLSGGTATYTHVFNRLRVRGVVDVENRNYGDSLTPGGEEIDQDFRDHTIYTGTAIGEYALSPSIALFVAGSVNKRDYRERTGPVAARDSNGFDFAAGASFELGRKARGSLRFGYLHQDYRPAEFEDVSGFLVRGELAYFLTPLVTITGTVDRGIRETGVNGATGYLATNMTLRADYELLRNLIISAGGELEKRDFNNIDRKDDRWTWRGSASYLVSKRLALRFDVQRRTQSSQGLTAGREFADNRASVGVTFSGL
ncbi:MAG: outer membrane beta-barrel protein [Sphingopyxis sp.]|uniref:outer membrane beta-barrel protein n=1 Tax=Sphingopyxis sp. TaxID=1908224 RepID=UPI001A3191BA|nr:outer membrane beta-barrel protein [Sphingopyxis sp.]MBJ7498469.1 outer membrane beta-barrel protein [Sphingopyxis sp.]